MSAGIFSVPAWIDESMLLKVHTDKIRKINSGGMETFFVDQVYFQRSPCKKAILVWKSFCEDQEIWENSLKRNLNKLRSCREYRWILLLDGSWVGWKFSSLAVALKSVHYAWQLALAVLCSWNPASLIGVAEKEKSQGQYLPFRVLIIEGEAVLALQRIFWNSWYGKYPTRWSLNHYLGFPTVLDWACRLFLKSCGQHGEWICHASRWN